MVKIQSRAELIEISLIKIGIEEFTCFASYK